jgi:hypothetical protein
MKHIKDFNLNEEWNGQVIENSYKERLLASYKMITDRIQEMSEEECQTFHQQTIKIFSEIFNKLP